VKGYLLDTNVLIALLWPSHAHHTRAVRWFTRHRSSGWATCPFTQAGFVRIVSNPAFSRDAVTPRDAVGVLATNTASKDHLFWPDELPLVEAVAFAGSKLLGHQQVTDAYLPRTCPPTGRNAGHLGRTHHGAGRTGFVSTPGGGSDCVATPSRRPADVRQHL